MVSAVVSENVGLCSAGLRGIQLHEGMKAPLQLA